MRDKVDFAEVEHQGKREYQEDACGFSDPLGRDELDASGKRGLLLVLADGMGGQAAGDVASKLAVNAFRRHFVTDKPSQEHFKSSLQSANNALADQIAADPDMDGMGCTLIGAIVQDHTLQWISVGDSLLLIIRNKQIIRVNRDHSMAPQIDEMVRSGELTELEGMGHPDRSALVSAVMGKKIPLIDSPKKGLPLISGDIVIAASDGIETLRPDEISEIVGRLHNSSAEQITHELLHEVLAKNDPYQDNVTIMAVKVKGGRAGGWMPGSGASKSDQPWTKSWLSISIFLLLVALTAFVASWFFMDFTTADTEEGEASPIGLNATDQDHLDTVGPSEKKAYPLDEDSGSFQEQDENRGRGRVMPKEVPAADKKTIIGDTESQPAKDDTVSEGDTNIPTAPDVVDVSLSLEEPSDNIVDEKKVIESTDPKTGEPLISAPEPGCVDKNLEPQECK